MEKDETGPPVVPVIGLTGGIAAGKSTVSERLGALGAHVIDADRVGHRVLMREGGEAYDGVVAAFGAEILDEAGEIARPRLGRLVFADPARLAELNRLTHPPMAERMRRRNRGAFGRSRPPRPSSSSTRRCCSRPGGTRSATRSGRSARHPERALERLVTRNRLSPEAARARIDAQLGNAEREARADRVIRNDGTLDALDAAVDALAAAAARGA